MHPGREGDVDEAPLLFERAHAGQVEIYGTGSNDHSGSLHREHGTSRPEGNARFAMERDALHPCGELLFCL